MGRRLTTLLATGAALALPAPAGAQGIDATCQLSLTRLDATTTNALAVDTNAVYWLGAYGALPGARIRIEGEFPHARYMGWNVYDPLGRPVDSIADEQIRPDRGSRNPSLPGAKRTLERRSYTLFVEFGPPPRDASSANRARRTNVIYTGDSTAGTFWYRVYIPDHGRDAKGGVPLPRVSVERSDSGGAASGLDACRELQAPYPTAANAAIATSPAVPVITGMGYPGRNPPNWRLFVNLSRGATDVLLDNETGEDFYDEAQRFPTNQSNSPGFFANRDIAYVFTGTSRGFGELLVIRARAPSFADTRSGIRRMPRGKDLRYWSLCQYEPAVQRVIACRSDDGVAVGPDGRFTFVVSTAGERPANARPRCGVTWLPWGPATQGLLIYRHMLARRSFRDAIQRIPEPGGERETMGDYYPAGEYLSGKGEFEARGCPPAGP